MNYSMDDETSPLTTIEWSMMDKHRFLALSLVNSLTLRSVLYPLTVIKTRLQVRTHYSGHSLTTVDVLELITAICSLICINVTKFVTHLLVTIDFHDRHVYKYQYWDKLSQNQHERNIFTVQKQNSVYRGTFDAFVKIINREGVRGLYKGFMVNTMQIVSGIGYITTYEKIRDILTNYGNVTDSRIKGLIGGGCGSVVSQTIITPFDVVSQHIMVSSGSKTLSKVNKFSSFANPLSIAKVESDRYGVAVAIVRELYRKDGFRGFYRGYFASLSTFVPSSALWWMFYSIYSEFFVNLVPIWTSHMFIHCIAGTAGGVTVAAITNPLDVIRANIQVHRLNSYTGAVRNLWKEEGVRVFYKGLSARITHSSISSAVIVVGYETMKRLSLGEEYRDKIKW